MILGKNHLHQPYTLLLLRIIMIYNFSELVSAIQTLGSLPLFEAYANLKSHFIIGGVISKIASHLANFKHHAYDETMLIISNVPWTWPFSIVSGIWYVKMFEFLSHISR